MNETQAAAFMQILVEELREMNANLERIADALEDMKNAPDGAATPSQGNETR